ncbi:MAG TPA: hypothetical protein VFN48_08920 [Solirubrobacteraceae bacterium]|nr:hypothetical protein [Solirubrobacteraceae bacterium]
MDHEDLLSRGWVMAEATLAGAASAEVLVTHWFRAPGDDSVNADAHFGSDERTLRFLAVALPTLVDQLAATHAIVAVPWGLQTEAASLTVVALASGVPAQVASRGLLRVPAARVAPFWTLGAGTLAVPAQITAVVDRLAI